MDRRARRKTLTHPGDHSSPFSPLSQHTSVLLLLFAITCVVGAVTWFNFASFFVKKPIPDNFGFDFLVYYDAAHAFVSGGDMYHPGPALSVLGNYLPYVYPPPAIYFFVPFTYVSFEQARLIVGAVYILALFLSVFFTVKIVRCYDVHVSRLALLLICVSLFLFEPIITTLVSLNVNLLILFLTTLFYYLLFVKKRSLAAGVALGLASIIKVWPAILLLLGFLHERSRKLVVGTIATIAALCAVSVWFQGFAAFREFITAFLSLEGNLFVTSREKILAPAFWDLNVSVTETVVKVVVLLNLNVQAALLVLDVLKVVFVGGVVVYLYKVSRIKKDASKLKEWQIVSFSVLFVLPLIVASLVWAYYTTFLVLPFILIVFVVPLTRAEKTVLWVSLALFATRTAILSLFFRIGGTPKIVAYVFEPPTIALVVFTALLLYILYARTKEGYWSAHA